VNEYIEQQMLDRLNKQTTAQLERQAISLHQRSLSARNPWPIYEVLDLINDVINSRNWAFIPKGKQGREYTDEFIEWLREELPEYRASF
jgi:hypothetical protein